MSGWTLFVDELVLQGSGDLDDMVGERKDWGLRRKLID